MDGSGRPGGWFRFEDLPLAVGENLFRVRALDPACADGFAELTVTRLSTTDCVFADGLPNWRVDIAAPLPDRVPGTVTISGTHFRWASPPKAPPDHRPQREERIRQPGRFGHDHQLPADLPARKFGGVEFQVRRFRQEGVGL